MVRSELPMVPFDRSISTNVVRWNFAFLFPRRASSKTLRLTTTPLENLHVDMIESFKVTTRGRVKDEQVDDTSRLDATNIEPAINIGKVAGRRSDRLAWRQADPVKQRQFEVQATAGNNTVVSGSASGKKPSAQLKERASSASLCMHNHEPASFVPLQMLARNGAAPVDRSGSW
jgi:hypothetical protein